MQTSTGINSYLKGLQLKYDFTCFSTHGLVWLVGQVILEEEGEGGRYCPKGHIGETLYWRSDMIERLLQSLVGFYSLRRELVSVLRCRWNTGTSFVSPLISCRHIRYGSATFCCTYTHFVAVSKTSLNSLTKVVAISAWWQLRYSKHELIGDTSTMYLVEIV